MEFKLSELSNIVQNILQNAAGRASADHATLITFSGDLGAGKTTMIQEMARQLGIGEGLTSPTFVIYKIYKIQTPHPNPLPEGEGVTRPWKNLIHADMYRLESSQEILQLGWEQLIADPDNLILIEWPEKISEIIPDWAGRVELRHVGDGDKRSVDMV